MFRLLLALAVFSAPAFAKKKKSDTFLGTNCCEVPARSADEENFYRKQKQASEYEARVGQAREDALIRSMADQYAGRVSSEAAISRLGFSSNKDSVYFYRGGGWDCRVRVSHGVTSSQNDCRDTFQGAVSCTSGTSNFSRTYSDQTARLLEQNGRCYQPGYGSSYYGYVGTY